MIQELVKGLVEELYNIEIDKDTRRAEYVEARAIYYKLLRENTYLSLDKIGKSVGRDHACVINGINRLEGWLSYDDRMIMIYSEISEKTVNIIKKIEGYRKVKTIDELTEDAKKFKALEQEYYKMYTNVVKQHNELLLKYNFVRSKLGRFHPNVIKEKEFDGGEKIVETLTTLNNIKNEEERV